MNTSDGRRAALALAALATLLGAWMQGCQSDKHTMVEPKPGTVVVCQKCYDEIATVRRRSGHRGPAYIQNVSVHQCEWCKSEMSIYSQEGVLMVRCHGCTPEGVPCDKCLPPKDYRPRPPQGIDVPAESNPVGSSPWR